MLQTENKKGNSAGKTEDCVLNTNGTSKGKANIAESNDRRWELQRWWKRRAKDTYERMARPKYYDARAE